MAAPTQPLEPRWTPSLGVFLLLIIVCLLIGTLLPAPFSTVALVIGVTLSLLYGIRALRADQAVRDTLPRPSRDVSYADGVAGRQPRRRFRFSPLDVLLPPDSDTRHAARGYVNAYALDYMVLFGLASVVLMVYATIDFIRVPANSFPSNGVLAFFVGLLFMILAVACGRRAGWLWALPELSITLPLPRAHVRRGIISLIVGLLFLVVLTLINAAPEDSPQRQVSTHLQHALLLFGVLLIGWGAAGAPLPRRGAADTPRERGLALEIVAVIGILALAYFLRTWQLETSMRVLVDELHWSDAIRGLEGEPNTPLLSQMSGTSPYTWVFPYWEAGGAQIFGHTMFGLRWASAMVGTFTVLATYGIARALFDRRAALLAGVLMAVFPAHVHLSRVAMTLIGDPLFGTLMIMFMARALVYNRRIDWAFAGVSLGLTQYFYEGGRLLYPPLAIGWLIVLFITQGGSLLQRLRAQRMGIFTMAFVAIIIALPPYITIWANADPVTGRLNDSGLGLEYWRELFSNGFTIDALGQAVERISTPFMFYVHRPEVGGVYYAGVQPLTPYVLVPLLLIGFVYLIARLRSPAVIVPIWLVATGLANGLLLRDNIVAARYAVMMPSIALAAAVALRYVVPMLLARLYTLTDSVIHVSVEAMRRRAWLVPGLSIVLLVVFSLAQIHYYWNDHLPLFLQQTRDFKPYRDGIDVALRAATLPDARNVQVILFGMPEHDQNVPRHLFAYLVYEDTYSLLSYRTERATARFLSELPRDRAYAFYVEPTDEHVINLITTYFPGAQVDYPLDSLRPDKEYVQLYVPAFGDEFKIPDKDGSADSSLWEEW